jgi:hypothetical protein
MLARPLAPAERMTDIFDRASTLNFTTVATISGPLSEQRLNAALRCLERRHPLLTARIAREGGACSLVPGEARPIPLFVLSGGSDTTQQAMEASLCHRVWDDVGPRAELSWVRHSPDRSTLLLCLHHVVSDGSSGILALRDLLALLDHPRPETIEALPAPGQDAFFPPQFASIRAQFMAAVAQGQPPAEGPMPFRLRAAASVPIGERRAGVERVWLSQSESSDLLVQGRRAVATVHGLVCAALSLAIAREPDAVPLQRLAHPVNLRRYLREYFPETQPIGDAIGYYVSAVNSDHQVEPTRELAALAREVTDAVRARKAEHEPLLTAPIRGPYFAERAIGLGLDAFRELAEQKVFTGTYGISNLGPLEQFGVEPHVGALELEDVFFAAAGSVMGALSASVVSFRGRLSVQLTFVEPLIARSTAQRIAQRMREILSAFCD